MQQVPFRFGEVVGDDSFINRSEERKRLTQLFDQSLNTILISPRRLGKSSLLQRSTTDWKQESKDRVVIHLDLFRYQTREAFFEHYLKEVIRGFSSKPEEWLRALSSMFSRLRPSISLDPMGNTQISITDSGTLDQKDHTEILELTEKLCRDRNKKAVVVLDEFQECERYEESVQFQQLLRSVWQHHNQVSYCISGSRLHMMDQLFSDRSMPFYRFADLLRLGGIDTRYWVEYIEEAFHQSGKKIEPNLIGEAAERLHGHPYYMQHLAWILWSLFDSVIEENQLDKAFDQLIAQNSSLFEHEVGSLTNTQRRVLQALSDGQTKLSSSEVLNTYKIPSSAHVYSALNKLEKADLVEKKEKNFILTDPLISYWIKRSF